MSTGTPPEWVGTDERPGSCPQCGTPAPWCRCGQLGADDLEQVKRHARAEGVRAFAGLCDADWGEFAYIDPAGMIGYADVPSMANEYADRIERGDD